MKLPVEKTKGDTVMADNLQSKVRSAAVAGWWTLLIAVAIFLVQWLVYLLVANSQPSWVLKLWGPGVTWETIRTVWFWFLAGFKALLLLAAFFLVWLTLWARQLGKCAGNP
jgi:hypothetical protein